jgi:hypothetical protein
VVDKEEDATFARLAYTNEALLGSDGLDRG